MCVYSLVQQGSYRYMLMINVSLCLEKVQQPHPLRGNAHQSSGSMGFSCH